MTSQQDGRSGFGNRLRRLREDAELSGKELAERLGWPASKVSRLENGKQTASAKDVRAWADAVLASPEVRAELVEDLRGLRVEYATWRRQLRTGFIPRQRAGVVLSHATTRSRMLTTTIIPGLLQTAEYARYVFSGLADFYDHPRDIDEAVRTRLRRQEVLYLAEKHFQFLLTEGALRARICPPTVLRAQLDRLLMLSGLLNVELAVLPADAPLPTVAMHGYSIYDDTLVLIETVDAELAIREQEDIALYERLFETLWEVALHGQDAFEFIAALARELGRPD